MSERLMADESVAVDMGERDRSSRRSTPALSPPHAINTRPNIARAPASNPSLHTLPPLITTSGSRRTSSTRVPSYASKRLSTFSNTSAPAARSRPGSVAFPTFHSSLPYALVRDFAYEPGHMLHYGPPLEPSSATSTNVSDFPRRLSDPPAMPSSRTQWSGHPGGVDLELYGGPQLPATSFSDGPPWREDDDLLSPVVSTRHRKAKSDMDYFGSRDPTLGTGSRRTSYAGTNADGSHSYYTEHVSEGDPGGPGGEIISYAGPGSRPTRTYTGDVSRGHGRMNGVDADDAFDDDEDSRYSRDYSFSIASPDEEMHGKAIALFDFESENDNELPLKEGQVLWVSYRHGEGWLVAKDPSTGEDGLVPESYVRLERDIPGGFGSLNGQTGTDAISPVGPDTPTMPPYPLERMDSPDLPAQSQYPMVAHFTTSKKDLLPHDKLTHTPISTSGSPSHQLDAQLEAVALGDKRETASPEEADDESSSSDGTADDRRAVHDSGGAKGHAIMG
ncbi:MAG: hypothetical protein Q9162_006396 [Coniocarpon cinnabarinum]